MADLVFLEPPRLHLANRRRPPGLVLATALQASPRLQGCRVDLLLHLRPRRGCQARSLEARARSSRVVPRGGGPLRNLRAFVALAELGSMARVRQLALLGRVDLIARGALQARAVFEFQAPLEAGAPACVADRSGTCPVCCERLGAETLCCRHCETGLHPDCWEYLGGCATYACPGVAGSPG